jgi:hypothetical protein
VAPSRFLCVSRIFMGGPHLLPLFSYINLNVQHIDVSGLCSWFGLESLFFTSVWSLRYSSMCISIIFIVNFLINFH